MIRRPPRSTPLYSSAASDVYKRQPCKELYACKDRDFNFYMFGSMGLVSSIGLGLALRTERTVVVFDGDGSLLMNPNALLEIGKEVPKNLMIIGLDNGAYGSTGSQETCALRYIDLGILANACGIQNTAKVNSLSLIHI